VKEVKLKVSPRKPSVRSSKAAPKPWEMQEDESLDQFRYFCFYRDMQRRSIHGVAKAFGLATPRQMEHFASSRKWVERCRAWDVEMDRRVRDLQTAAVAEMRKRQINIGIGMQQAVAKELRAWVVKIELAEEEARKVGKKAHDPVLSISDLIRLCREGTTLERLNRGEPVAGGDSGDHDLDLSALSAEELKLLQALQKKMRGEG
jgi:hypothetical protein